MSNMVLTRKDDKIFQLQGFSELNGRTAMKLNIFLNSLKDVQVIKNDDFIDFDFLSLEYYPIAKKLQEIISFIESCGIELVVDEEIISIQRMLKDYQDSSVTRKETLLAIKNDDKSVKEQFDDFCSFCDNSMIIQLRDYQYKSAFLLSEGGGGFDFSVPGAGKTIITYAAYARLKEKGEVECAFVIGPGSAVNAWREEYITCFDREPDFEDLSSESVKNVKIYLKASSQNHKEISFINFDKIRMLKEEISNFLESRKTLLIIDEGHKVKNPSAASTEAALEISKHSYSRIILTGTPMPNGYEDLYSLTDIYSPFEPILPYKYNQLKLMTKNGASEIENTKIHESLDPYYSRISKKYLIERGELLPYETTIIQCSMNDEQVELYRKLNEFCGKLSDDLDEELLLNLKKAVLIRKMQISANPALLKKSIINSMDELRAEYAEEADKENADINWLAKADKELMEQFAISQIVKIINRFDRGDLQTNKNIAATDLVAKLVNSGKKVLVWDIFVSNMECLRDMIEKRINMPVELVNGTVSGIDRKNAIDNFRNGKSMVLLANPSTLAESISLHKACQDAIYVNRNFNAAQFIQSKDRIHRINMPEGTTAHYYFIENIESIDSAISEKLNMKEQRMLKILDADDIVVGGSEMEDIGIMSSQDVMDTYMR